MATASSRPAAVLRSLPRWVRRGVQDPPEDILLLSAGLGFYALVSLVPLAVVVLWVSGLIAGDQRMEALAQAVGRFAPQDFGVDRALLRVAEAGTSLGLVAVVAAVWPASAYGSGLRRAFVRLSPGLRKDRMPGLRGRGLLLLVLLPVFVLGTLVASVTATGLFSDLAVLGWILSVPLAFAVAGVGVALTYRIFPPKRLSWPAVARGASVVAVGVALLSLAFTLFLAVGADFERHYVISGVAGLVLLALWLFLANALLLIGYRAARAVDAT
jgi:membrane protein